MLRGVFLIGVGAFLGAFVGLFGSALGMALAGGGHSHSDMFTYVGCGVLGIVAGAVVGPVAIVSTNYGLVTRRRCRLEGTRPPRAHARAAFEAVASALSGFAAFVAFYYSTAIAELPAQDGGPLDNPDPAGRARWTMSLAAALAIAAVFLFVRAFLDRPRRPID